MKRAIVLSGILVLLACFWGLYRIGPHRISAARRQFPQTVKPEPMRHSFALVDRSGDISRSIASPGLAEPKTVEGSAESDFAASLVCLLSNTKASAIEARRSLIRRWAESDPAAAAAWTAGLTPGPIFQDLLQQVVIAWAETDPEAANQWLSALVDGEAKHAALISLAYEAARDKPLLAVGLAAGLPPTPERDDLLVHATSQWASLDLESALGWAEQVSASDLRQRLIAAIATASAKLDGAGAAAMVANLIPPGAEQNRAAVAVAQRWAESAPQAANDWVAGYPAGPVREAAIRGLLDVNAAQQSSQSGRGPPEMTVGQEP